MSNCSRCRCRRISADPPAPPASGEPPVRRWPHPIATVESASREDTALSIRCAMACQTKLLEEISDSLTQNNTLTTEGNALLTQINTQLTATYTLLTQIGTQLTAANALLTQIEKNTAPDTAAKE